MSGCNTLVEEMLDVWVSLFAMTLLRASSRNHIVGVISAGAATPIVVCNIFRLFYTRHLLLHLSLLCRRLPNRQCVPSLLAVATDAVQTWNFDAVTAS